MSVDQGVVEEMKAYDFVFSLGAACSCSQSLRLANLQFASFPCDWLWGRSPVVRAKALTGGFDALLDESRLVKHGVPWKLEHESWRNLDTGIVFKREAFIDNAKMAAFLASEYSMPDYRSEAERAAWPARRRALKYARFNAVGWWGYHVNRFWYRLYRHVRKEIERRGLHRLG